MKWIILVITLLFVGCESLSQRHATRALLLTVDPQSDVNNFRYSLKNPIDNKFYSGNPIFIHSDTKFSIKIEEISAGWIYKENSSSNYQSDGQGYNDLSLPSYDPNIIPADQFNHYRGLDLWLLTTISSLNPNDPLETKNKRYFKATNVKFDSQSYSLVPVDSDERYVFTHESDSSYRVKFQLYSVKGFAVKRELSKIASNPGVWGVGSAFLTTLKNTFGSVVGDVVASSWNEKISEDLAIERFLLSVGATEELHANLVVVRKDSFENRRGEFDVKAADVTSLLNVPGNESMRYLLESFKRDDKYSFPTPLKKTSYIVLDYYKTANLDENARHRGGKSADNRMLKCNENIIVDSRGYVLAETDAKLSNTCELDVNADVSKDNNSANTMKTPLNDFTYLKISVIESDSTQKFIDGAGNIQNNKGAAHFKGSVIPLLRGINDNQVNTYSNNLTNLKSELAKCNEIVCEQEKLTKLNDDIAKAQNDYNTISASHKKGLDAIEKINNQVSLDEWVDHIQRQPD